MTGGLSGRLALAAALAVTMAGCGGRPADEGGATGGLTDVLRTAAAQQVAGWRGRDTPPPVIRSDAQIAADALAVNPAPLILVKLESEGGRAQAMAMVGENGDRRSFQNPASQMLILRDGMLSGTRGFGHDLSVADAAGSAALIRAGRAGNADRVMRYYTGDGREGPLPLQCVIEPAAEGVMAERCTAANGLAIDNTYVVQQGTIAASRQWIGPSLGYADIVTLRP